ncbi:MAG: MarC family protein [Mesorhizobium sp.]|nr:MAG: MarC family protein [Mesorhizobium sp.]
MAIRLRITNSGRGRRTLFVKNFGRLIALILVFAATVSAASAQGVAAPALRPGALSAWTFGEVFTFLFVTLGPLNVILPFLGMTQGRSAAFKRQAAFTAFSVALIGLLVVAAIGAATLKAWGISIGALLLTGGAILVLVALRPVLAGYSPRAGEPSSAANPASATELAFSPLAFPTIVTPYGLALLVLLVTLYPASSEGLWVLAMAALVLALDLIVMLAADRIAKIPLVNPGLNILGCVMNVLLIALGVQAVADGLRLIAEQRF